MNRTLALYLIAVLALSYVLGMLVSLDHLVEWYKRYPASHPELALFLALSLEVNTLLLSATSVILLESWRGWSFWGSLVSLGLIWYGNHFTMSLVSPDPSRATWWKP